VGLFLEMGGLRGSNAIMGDRSLGVMVVVCGARLTRGCAIQQQQQQQQAASGGYHMLAGGGAPVYLDQVFLRVAPGKPISHDVTVI
jgi:hypothetical protein